MERALVGKGEGSENGRLGKVPLGGDRIRSAQKSRKEVRKKRNKRGPGGERRKLILIEGKKRKSVTSPEYRVPQYLRYLRGGKTTEVVRFT